MYPHVWQMLDMLGIAFPGGVVEYDPEPDQQFVY